MVVSGGRTSGEAGRGGSLASLSVELLSLSLSEPELLSDPLRLLESSLEGSAPSLLLLLLLWGWEEGGNPKEVTQQVVTQDEPSLDHTLLFTDFLIRKISMV